VVLATRDDSDPEAWTRYEKSVSNIQCEVKARERHRHYMGTTGDTLRAKTPIHHRTSARAGVASAADWKSSTIQLLRPHRGAPRLRRDQPRNWPNPSPWSSRPGSTQIDMIRHFRGVLGHDLLFILPCRLTRLGTDTDAASSPLRESAP